MKPTIQLATILLLLASATPAELYAQFYANGGLNPQTLSASGVAAPQGSFWSEVQPDAVYVGGTNGNLGWAGDLGFHRLADDFTIPPGQSITLVAVDLYAYKRGAGIGTSPFAAYYLKIWRGQPEMPGSELVFGDEATNRLESSTFTGYYRIWNSLVPAPGATPSTSRAIWRNRVAISPGLTLNEGTYWLDWTARDTAGSIDHYHPTVTIPGTRTIVGANARNVWLGDGIWDTIIDAGLPSSLPDVSQEFPFELYAAEPETPTFANGFEDGF